MPRIMAINRREPAYQVIVRLPADIASRLEALTQLYLARSLLKGVKVGRATVAREAITIGLPLLEAEFAKEVQDQ